MSESVKPETGMTRKELLGSGAGAAASALLLSQGLGIERAVAAQASARRDVSGMNIVLFISDQERGVQHFPPNWIRKNLPGMRRLMRNGVSFERAYTNACMCSPARTTMMTGYYPAQHGVKYTLETYMPSPEYPQVEMPVDLPNLATVMSAAGYNVIYKGKWHCSKPAGSEFAPSDLSKYGFGRWNPPDAGANQSVGEAGGGSTNNDGRIMNSVGEVEAGTEGALQYLGSTAAQQQPFFMIVSIVNPHDVLFYPSRTFEEAGYDESWLSGSIKPPPTASESLATKPTVQEEFRRIFNLTGKPKTRAEQRNYLNFYGNLMKGADKYLVDVLDKLEETGLYDNTLVIRTSDHGEMGLAHGMRQKCFNFYEEAMRVPLVYSNPKLFPRPVTSKALVSHVDFLPTLASLAGTPRSARADWAGTDYSGLVTRPYGKRKVQNQIVFTYDDFQFGQPKGPYPKPPNHIVSLREERWKLAKYYDVKGKKRPQWEMYDLKTDPLEQINLAFKGHKRTQLQDREFRRLKRKLARIQRNKLRPLQR